MYKLTEIQSSAIQAVGSHDNYLIVKFKSGSIYRYPDMAHALKLIMESDSKGKYFHSNIRGADFEKICSNGCWALVVNGKNICQECLSILG